MPEFRTASAFLRELEVKFLLKGFSSLSRDVILYYRHRMICDPSREKRQGEYHVARLANKLTPATENPRGRGWWWCGEGI